MTACDVVTLTRQADAIPRLGGATENYRVALERLGDSLSDTEAAEFLGGLLGAQKGFLAEASRALVPDDYLNSPRCRVIVSLVPGFDTARHSENMTGPLAAKHSNAMAIVQNLEADLKNFLSRVRFQSEADRLSASAKTLCTAAAVLDAVRGEPDQDAHPLEAYGETVGCDRVNRISSEWPLP